ncbi:MAG: tryptophan--tRNA ligase [Candidatus Sumerlaea chitinivorans]|nr:tryptophan--tRNA ligase [Candidatus Sumerlaea chitinivorans]
MKRPRLLSGMQPTGPIHLGRLEGALRQWVRLQNEGNYDMFCFVANWHSYTTQFKDPAVIEKYSRMLVVDYISVGLDPEKTAIFLQSDVKQHAELHLLLSMITPVGWLERQPTYKDKIATLAEKYNEENVAEYISYGLLGYPVLQAADILIYKAEVVPVGRDQAPHLEIAREIARRFNHLYGEIFPEPQALISEATGTLPGIDRRKMSSSYGNAIFIRDTPEEVVEKVNQMVTTETKIRKTDPGVPENCVVCQLRKIYDPEGYLVSWEEDRQGKRGCTQNKKELAEILNAMLDPIRRKREELERNPDYVEEVLRKGAERAAAVAEETMREVRAAMKLRP